MGGETTTSTAGPQHCPHNQYHAHADVQGAPPLLTVTYKLHCALCGALFRYTGQVGINPDNTVLGAQVAMPATSPNQSPIWTPP